MDGNILIIWHSNCFIHDSRNREDSNSSRSSLPIKLKKEYEMAINFYLNREQLVKEIEQWVASSNLDAMLGFCRCCVNSLYEESTLVNECLKCSIQQGITKMSNNRKEAYTRDLEFLGVC